MEQINLEECDPVFEVNSHSLIDEEGEVEVEMDFSDDHCDDEESNRMDIMDNGNGIAVEDDKIDDNDFDEDVDVNGESREEPNGVSKIEEPFDEKLELQIHPHLQHKLYCGLMSYPSNDTDIATLNCPKLVRPLNIAKDIPSYNVTDYYTLWTKSRQSKRNSRSTKYSSRQSRTFSARLSEFRPILENYVACKTTWNNVDVVDEIIQLSAHYQNQTELGENNSPEDGDPSSRWESAETTWDTRQAIPFKAYRYSLILFGYILKCASVDHSKLYKLCKDIGVIPLPPRPSVKNLVFLEDHTAKIRLSLDEIYTNTNKLNFEELVSGIPIAVKGLLKNGRIYVEDWIFATPPSPQIPLSTFSGIVEMVFVSGLNISGSNAHWPALDLLTDYLMGISGSVVEQDKIIRKKSRVFFLGNSFYKQKHWNPDYSEDLIAESSIAAEKLDSFFSKLSECMEVYVIPGENDPTHQTALPQPSIHRHLFPMSERRPSFRNLGNPAKIYVPISCHRESDSQSLECVSVILSSGSNVKNTMQYCDIECPLEMSSNLLEWSHLYPGSTEDNEIAHSIFNLKDSLPHLFVVGGLLDSGVKHWKGTKIVAVPSFAATNTVMVLARNGNVLPLSFKVTI